MSDWRDKEKARANAQTSAGGRKAASGGRRVAREDSRDFERDERSVRTAVPFAYNYTDLQVLLRASEGQADSLLVVLDHITDVGNFGAVVRSAEIVGAVGIVIPNKRAAQVNDGVFRASAGAIEHIKVARQANIATSLELIKKAGYWVGAATEHAQQSIWDAPLGGRIAIVMGSEDSGISRLVREQCDFEFKLPQVGVTQSLNVAQAFTAIAYEWLRRSR